MARSSLALAGEALALDPGGRSGRRRRSSEGPATASCLGAEEVGSGCPRSSPTGASWAPVMWRRSCALPVAARVAKPSPRRCPEGRAREDGRGRAAHDRGGISDGGGAGRSLAQPWTLAFDAELRRSEALRAGVPQEPPSRLEPGRPRAFQSRREPEGRGAPFAFLATYTTRLSAEAKAQHLPLGKALQEYAGAEEPRAPAVAADAGPARRRSTAPG